MKKSAPWLVVFVAVMSAGASAGPPSVAPPGDAFVVPETPTASGAPVVYEHSGEAGPDQTIFLVGERLGDDVTAWGVSADRPGGQEWKLRVMLGTENSLAAAVPEGAHDGPFVVRVRNRAGVSTPVVINAPQPWWCSLEPGDGRPDPTPGGPATRARVFGRNLARRPDFARAHVYVSRKDRPGTWARVTHAGKYAVSFELPTRLDDGTYDVWLHAGAGGHWGWGGPVPLTIRAGSRGRSLAVDTALRPGASGDEIQHQLDARSLAGGGTVTLPPGVHVLTTTLVIPTGVRLAGPGSGQEASVLQLHRDPSVGLPRLGDGGWNQAPGRVHSPGDHMAYDLDVPTAGDWAVWVRYATDMAAFSQPGVSGNHAITVDDGPAVPLMKLENTGGWGTFRWSNSAAIQLTAGKHRLTWRNIKGGGVSLDAFAFVRDTALAPTAPGGGFPASGPDRVVIQAEDCTRFVTREGELPGGDRAVVWVRGDDAALEGVTLMGDARTNIGVEVRATEPLRWLRGVRVRDVKVADVDGKQAENCALHVRNVEGFEVSRCELWGRVPIMISGARRSRFLENRLVPVTRYGGNAEASILGRTEPIEECVVEANVIASPPGAEAGGPTTRRLLWFSTGHGSVAHNYIAYNGTEVPVATVTTPSARPNPGVSARFGGVAGTDQNVGEMILFEGNHRTMFFGSISGSDARSVTLPETIPATPDARLGSVTRDQLAHDAKGKETPFWPPDVDDGGDEPPLREYFVTVFSGRGQGQTRRVSARQGPRLTLDREWRVPPAAGSVVAVGTMFYQNLIVGNRACDGMTGIQLWISCVENVVSGNAVERQRKPGLFLYANGTTLASSMPRTWNRGISPLFWNTAEGNRVDECSAGALVTSGDEGGLPVEFPRALGNVLRFNSFVRNRTDGVILTGGGRPDGGRGTSASVVGTIVEFNVVRDALTAFHAAGGSDGTIFRRNHAYFWYPVNHASSAPVGFQVDPAGARFAVEANSVEGIHGVWDGNAVDLRTPAGDRKIPQ